MSAEFFKTTIPAGKPINKVTAQTAVQGDIIIPDSKEDVKDVLLVTAMAIIRDEKVTDGRVSFGGDVKVNVLYSSPTGKVHSVSGMLPFVDFINSDSVKKGDKANIAFRLLNTKAKVVNDRKISVRTIGEISSFLFDEDKQKSIINGCRGEGVQVLNDSISVFKVNSIIREEFEVEDKFNLPSSMPEIDKIIKTNILVKEYFLTPSEDRVAVRGSLVVSALYVTKDGNMEKAEFKIPFSGNVEAMGVTSSSIVWGEVFIKDYEIEAEADENGTKRIISVEAEITADIKSGENVEISPVKDVYSLNGYTEKVTETILFPEKGVYTTASDTVREIITIGEGYPDIMQIKDVCLFAEVDDIHIKGEMLDVEGVLYVTLLYLTGDDDEPYVSVETALPFENSIEIKGLYDDAEVDITTNITDINYSLITSREAEIRATIDYGIFALMENEMDFVTEANIDETVPLKVLPGITIYTVRKGDALWNIAKKFGTTVDEILSVNRIENKDLIYPGQRILVLKRI